MDQIDFKRLRGWPYIWIGLAATLLYLLGIAVFFLGPISELFSRGLAVSELGNGLSGLFSPLALVWLIVGILQQGKELQIQVHDLKESVDAQKSMAKSTGGQERLLVEQFAERKYKIYKRSAEDILFLLLDPEHLVFISGGTRNYLVDIRRIKSKRDSFVEGRREELLSLSTELVMRLNEQTELNKLLADSLLNSVHAARVKELADDFVRIDALRLDALLGFEGGDVLQRVDSQQGFSDARKLAEGLRRFLCSNP